MKHCHFFSSFFKFGQRCQLHIFCMAGEGDTLQFSLLFLIPLFITLQNMQRSLLDKCRTGSVRPGPFQDPAHAIPPSPLPRGPMATTHSRTLNFGGHLVPPPRRSARGLAGLLFLFIIHTDFLFLLRTLNRKVCSRRASDVQSYRFVSDNSLV